MSGTSLHGLSILLAVALVISPSVAAADVAALVAGFEAWTGRPFPTDHEHELFGPSLDFAYHELGGYERVGFGVGGYALRGQGELSIDDENAAEHDVAVYGGRLTVNATSTGFGYGFGLLVEAGLSPMYVEIGDEKDWVLGFFGRFGLGGVLGPLVWKAEVGVLSANLIRPAANVGGLTAGVGVGWDFEGHADSLPDEPDDDENGGPRLDIDAPRRVPVPPGGVTLLVRVSPRGGVSAPVLVSVRASSGVRWELLPPRAEDPQAWELRVDRVPRDGGTVEIRATAGDIERRTRVELYRGFEAE